MFLIKSVHRIIDKRSLFYYHLSAMLMIRSLEIKLSSLPVVVGNSVKHLAYITLPHKILFLHLLVDLYAEYVYIRLVEMRAFRSFHFLKLIQRIIFFFYTIWIRSESANKINIEAASWCLYCIWSRNRWRSSGWARPKSLFIRICNNIDCWWMQIDETTSTVYHTSACHCFVYTVNDAI